MLLSEAIRLGAMLKPQGFGNGSGYAGAPTTCALAAACDATGISEFDAMASKYPGHVLNGCVYRNDGMLGDGRKWTREEIADWVEQWERENGMRPASPESENTEKHGTPVTAGVAP